MPGTKAPVVVIHETDVPYDEIAPGNGVARAVTELGSTVLGGGWARIKDDERGLKWQLHYDEVLFVHRGHISVEVSGRIYTAQEGEAIVIPKGTVVTYRGDGLGFFVLYPGNWAESVPGGTGRVD